MGKNGRYIFMNKRFAKAVLLLLILPLMLLLNFPKVNAQKTIKDDILHDIEQIIHWKKSSVGITEDESLFNSSFLNNAGDASGDWYPIGIGRIGYPDDYDGYLAVIGNEISKRYRTESKLHESKATEWHRISLAILAMGGDPTSIGIDENGQPINLIADGTYYRGKDAPIGLQGINGLTWGLITLDSMLYRVPNDAVDNRNDIITEIMARQLDDGGFALSGEVTDTDITGMVIQALAPYYNSEESYQYKQINTENEVNKTVREVIDEALASLSKVQLENGGFTSMEMENTESIAQVIVALTELGIDPLTDERFIKNGENMINALKTYQMEDGGFIHSHVYDEENPDSLPDESNSMASEQALYALISLYRFYNENRTLYDFREELNKEQKEKIDYIKQSIEGLPSKITNNDRDNVSQLFELYKKIPLYERRYVFNYYKLSDAMKELDIENDSEFIASFVGEIESGKGTITPLFTKEFNHGPVIFTEVDIEYIEKLQGNLSTEHYVEVVKLLDKLNSSENKREFEQYIPILQEKKEKLEILNAEIETLNKDIIDNLFPFDQISKKDRQTIREIIERYEQLGEYDKAKIINYEDVEKAKAQVDSLIRAQYITIAVVISILIGIVVFIIRNKNRKNRKLQKMYRNVD